MLPALPERPTHRARSRCAAGVTLPHGLGWNLFQRQVGRAGDGRHGQLRRPHSIDQRMSRLDWYTGNGPRGVLGEEAVRDPKDVPGGNRNKHISAGATLDHASGHESRQRVALALGLVRWKGKSLLGPEVFRWRGPDIFACVRKADPEDALTGESAARDPAVQGNEAVRSRGDLRRQTQWTRVSIQVEQGLPVPNHFRVVNAGTDVKRDRECRPGMASPRGVRGLGCQSSFSIGKTDLTPRPS